MIRHEHEFTELPSAQRRRGYFKRLPDGGYDQSIVYTMLYCPQCGETKEVVAADHTHALPTGFSETANDL
jgi:hypothetical protein